MLYTYYNEKLLKLLTNSETTKILDEENHERKRRTFCSGLGSFDENNQELCLQRVNSR